MKEKTTSLWEIAIYVLTGLAGLFCAFLLSNVWLKSSYSKNVQKKNPKNLDQRLESNSLFLKSFPSTPFQIAFMEEPATEASPPFPPVSPASPSFSVPSKEISPIGTPPSEDFSKKEEQPPMGSSFPFVEESDDSSSFQPKKDYIYVPYGKRDPFRVLVNNIRNEGTEANPSTELQQYELNQLKVLGIIWGGGKAKAMIMDPNGKDHIVTEGMNLGRQGGKIKMIRGDRVIVEEPREESQSKEGKIIRILKIRE